MQRDKALEDAREHFHKKEYKAALISVDRALNIDPDYKESIQLHTEILHCMSESRQPRKSVISENFSYTLALVQSSNNKKMILDNVKRLSKHEGPSSKTLLMKGSAELVEGNFQEALKDLTESISLEPGKPEVYYKRACVHYALKNFRDALKDLDKTIELDSKFGDAYLKKGEIYINEIVPNRKSVDCFQDALRLSPEDLHITYKLGLAFSSIAEDEEAMKMFNVIISKKPKISRLDSSIDVTFTKALYQKGLIFLKHGEKENAKMVLTECVEQYPSYAEAKYQLARIASADEEYEYAKDLLEECIEIKPEFTEAKVMLGKLTSEKKISLPQVNLPLHRSPSKVYPAAIEAEENTKDDKETVIESAKRPCCIVMKAGISYDNPLLNQRGFIEESYKIDHSSTSKIIELGQYPDVAAQIVKAIEDSGPKNIAELFFKNNSPVGSAAMVMERELYQQLQGKHVRESIVDRVVYDIIWKIKLLMHHEDVVKFESILRERNIAESIDVLKNYSGFKRNVLLKLHPDKHGNDEEFSFAKNLHEKFDADLDMATLLNNNALYIQSVIGKATVSFKALDTLVPSLRLIYEPTLGNIKELLFESIYLYGMVNNLNYYSYALTAIDISCKIYNGQYDVNLKQLLSLAMYAVVPDVLRYFSAQYIPLGYGAIMLVYTGYNSIHNLYSFLQEGDEDMPIEEDSSLIESNRNNFITGWEPDDL